MAHRGLWCEKAWQMEPPKETPLIQVSSGCKSQELHSTLLPHPILKVLFACGRLQETSGFALVESVPTPWVSFLLAKVLHFVRQSGFCLPLNPPCGLVTYEVMVRRSRWWRWEPMCAAGMVICDKRTLGVLLFPQLLRVITRHPHCCLGTLCWPSLWVRTSSFSSSFGFPGGLLPDWSSQSSPLLKFSVAPCYQGKSIPFPWTSRYGFLPLYPLGQFPFLHWWGLLDPCSIHSLPFPM